MHRLIKCHRLRLGLSQLEVAERLGCDRTTIAAYESGKIGPSLGMARKLAKLFGISMDELTADEPEDDALALETATAP